MLSVNTDFISKTVLDAETVVCGEELLCRQNVNIKVIYPV